MNQTATASHHILNSRSDDIYPAHIFQILKFDCIHQPRHSTKNNLSSRLLLMGGNNFNYQQDSLKRKYLFLCFCFFDVVICLTAKNMLECWSKGPITLNTSDELINTNKIKIVTNTTIVFILALNERKLVKITNNEDRYNNFIIMMIIINNIKDQQHHQQKFNKPTAVQKAIGISTKLVVLTRYSIDKQKNVLAGGGELFECFFSISLNRKE
eukprot:gene11531-7951_t